MTCRMRSHGRCAPAMQLGLTCLSVLVAIAATPSRAQAIAFAGLDAPAGWRFADGDRQTWFGIAAASSAFTESNDDPCRRPAAGPGQPASGEKPTRTGSPGPDDPGGVALPAGAGRSTENRDMLDRHLSRRRAASGV
jgi:hypothetical protein